MVAMALLSVVLVVMLSWGYVNLRQDQQRIKHDEAQALVNLAHSDAQACQARVEGRQGIRELVLFIFNLPGHLPPTPSELTIENQILAKFPALTCKLEGR